MKFYSLNKYMSSPCMVLKLKDITIMLDCHLDMSPLLNYLPTPPIDSKKWTSLRQWMSSDVKHSLGTETNLYEVSGRVFIDSMPEVCTPQDGLVDFASIDVILISNFFNILALPFITQYSGFGGKVLATEPTLEIGRLLMEELVTLHESSQRCKKFTAWKSRDIQKFLPFPLCDFEDAVAWEGMYTKQDISNCIGKIQCVGFAEKIDILGLMQVTAHSSGYGIGSANWVLQTPFFKIDYISSSSLYATHSIPMEQNALKDADVCIMNSLTPSCTTNPDSMLREFCSHVGVTLKNGGNVLVPCFPTGVIYDLFEYLCSFMDGSGLTFVPIYFISPVAHSSLEYANIYAEWLNQNKQNKMYLPEPPFLHHELIRNGRVKHFPNLHAGLSNNFKSPCIVFAGHPSLRFGDAVHFMELWGQGASNTVIFIDSEFPHLDALTPFQPIAMKMAYCPVDPRLNFHQAHKLLKEIKPKQLIIPDTYTSPPMMMPNRTDLVISAECPVQTYKHLSVLDIPLNKNYAKVTMSPEIASTLCPKQLEAGVAVAMVSGKVVTRDNKHTLKRSDSGDKTNQSGPCLLGDVDVEQFMMALKNEGIMTAEVEATDTGHIVHFPDIDAMIQLEPGNTHIINHTNDRLRVKIKTALLSCLLQV